MLRTTSNNDPDILEQLRHPEQRRQKQQMSRNLFIRNILNVLFIIVALVAMVGILVSKEHIMVWYVVGLFAVMIKMVAVMLRMPGFKK